MKTAPAEIDEYLKLLEETPRRLAKLTKPFDEIRLQQRTEKENWSVNDILAHLRSCADVWGDSIERMLAEDHPTVPYRHPRQWIKKTDYPQLPFEDWSRAATIKGIDHTVFSQVRQMTKHEQVHCEQIETLLK